MSGFSSPIDAVSITGPVKVDINNPVTLIDVRGSLLGNSLAAGASVSYDIYQFATLTLSVNSNPAGKVSLVAETFTNTLSNNFFNATVCVETFSISDTTQTGHFAIPVLGNSITFTNNGTQPVQIWLYGHTRSWNLSTPIILGGQNAPRQLRSIIVAPATSTPFTSVDSGPDSTGYNSRVRARISVSTGASTTKPFFVIQMQYYDPVATRTYLVIDSAAFHLRDGTTNIWECFQEFTHPVAVVNWVATATTALGAGVTATFNLELIPE